MTIIDTVDNAVRTEIDNTRSKPLHTIYPEKTQHAFLEISKKSYRKGTKNK